MARYKKMTEAQILERDRDLESLREILNSDKYDGVCMKLSQLTGKSYSTILQIKNNKPNPHYSTVKMLLKAVEQL